MGKPVVHFEIIGSDTPALHTFYSQLFDWQVQDVPGMGYGLVTKEETGTIGGGIGHSDDADGRGTVVYIEVDDPQAYLNKAETLGGKTIVPVTEVPNMVTFAQFLDPQGNRIGLVKSAS